jgi:hypothetical protein
MKEDILRMASPFSDRRKHPRYPCDVGVQIRASHSSGGYWGTLADVSLGGCYVYTFSPLTLGTGLTLTLGTGEDALMAEGVVVTFHPGVGMGIEFTGFVKPDGELRLKALIASLESKLPSET